MNEILIIGAGVIGLTTAVRLQEAGFQVSIISKTLPEQSTSAKAAAIWLPFEVEPMQQVNAWSLKSYHRFEALAALPDSGIQMTDFLVLLGDNELPKWADALPATAHRMAHPSELPEGYLHGRLCRVPLIDTPIYLPYLLQQFAQNGGELYLESIQSLMPLFAPERLLINCTGLGAAALTGDTSLYPIAGQIVKIKAQDSPCIANNLPGELAYVIPRKEGIMLGGTAERGNYREEPKAEVTAGIIQRCRSLAPQLDYTELLDIQVGLRPARPTIRLELETDRPLIHNYGHGGGGFTVSWGCAESVLDLVHQFIRQ
ncbi:MAG: FAD-dependent oxidoreductase [Bacteroidota bacterium]